MDTIKVMHPAASLAQILGLGYFSRGTVQVLPVVVQPTVYYCHVTGLEIPPERVEILREMGVNQADFTHVSAGDSHTKRRKGAVVNEDGDLVICDSVGESLESEPSDEPKEEDPETSPGDLPPSGASQKMGPGKFSLPKVVSPRAETV